MKEEDLKKLLNEIKALEKKSVSGEEVELIAVSKTKPFSDIKEVSKFGIKNFGENKVQELIKKIEENNLDINFHFIGNLQTNKVKYIYNKVKIIHSLDNEKLAKEIDKRAKKDDIIVNCLIQINIGNESQKGGIDYNDAEFFVEEMFKYNNLKVQGLMAIAPLTSDEKFLRDCFRRMFELKEKIKNKNYSEADMKYLSMGMSGDYKIAIEEGSNMVRIGSLIFGKRI